jgi:hypothetical protein
VGLASPCPRAAPPTLRFRPSFITAISWSTSKRPSVLYASFWIYGVYKSQDYGKTWRPVNGGLKNASVYALAMSARDPDVLFAGTHAGGMYRSSDGGSSWTEINTGLTSGTIWDLAVLPGGWTVYALTSPGSFRPGMAEPGR